MAAAGSSGWYCSDDSLWMKMASGPTWRMASMRVQLHARDSAARTRGRSRRTVRGSRVLEVADPVGHAEMAEVHHGHDVELQQFTERQVGELPVEAVRARPGAVDGRAIP